MNTSIQFESSLVDRVRAVSPAREFTGMVYCEQRLSSIAILRCGEYQKAFHCRCGSGAPRWLIDLVRTNGREDKNKEAT